MAMKRVLRTTWILLALGLAAAPAGAGSFTVFWDRPSFGGFAAGYGVTEATATSAATNGGIPIRQVANVPGWNPTSLPVDHAVDPSTLRLPVPVGSAPAAITSAWSAVNQTGNNSGSGVPQDLYLVYMRPNPTGNVNYDPIDIGLTLQSGTGGLDWAILQVPVASGNSVYYPAISLGTLANGATAAFPLLYTLDNPQVFTETFNFVLGMPRWSLGFVTIPIPEVSTGLLVVLGLLWIARTRPKRA
jgi:hypothetical protein